MGKVSDELYLEILADMAAPCVEVVLNDRRWHEWPDEDGRLIVPTMASMPYTTGFYSKPKPRTWKRGPFGLVQVPASALTAYLGCPFFIARVPWKVVRIVEEEVRA